MRRAVSGDIKAKRMGMGDLTLKLGRVIHGTIKQKLERTGIGDVRLEKMRTQQGFT